MVKIQANKVLQSSKFIRDWAHQFVHVQFPVHYSHQQKTNYYYFFNQKPINSVVIPKAINSDTNQLKYYYYLVPSIRTKFIIRSTLNGRKSERTYPDADLFIESIKQRGLLRPEVLYTEILL